jgi:Flp pilus assembly pilin Flp
MYAKTNSTLMRRLLRDESGQDIIEYVLLTAALGVASMAVWPLIAASIGQSYRQLDTNTQSLWMPPDPAGGGS